MRILFLGDVVSEPGCEFVRRKLPGFKKLQQIDFCIVNGENSAKGNGITPQSAEHLLASGADLLTTGNHVFKRPEAERLLDGGVLPVIRPANFHRSAPGKGVWVLEKRGLRLGVANLIGRVNMDQADDPFDCADRILKEFADQGVRHILIDFHAEATSEKRAMGFWVNGRASALVGTHTHVQTADAQLLSGGTAYITDAGMAGVMDSVLGVSIESATYKMRTGLPVRFEHPEGDCSMQGAVIETDPATGRATSIESFCIE